MPLKENRMSDWIKELYESYKLSFEYSINTWDEQEKILNRIDELLKRAYLSTDETSLQRDIRKELGL